MPSSEGKGSPQDGDFAQMNGTSPSAAPSLPSPSPEVPPMSFPPTSYTSSGPSSSWPFPRWKDSLVEAAVETFRILETSQQKEWDDECAKYEEFETVSSSSSVEDEGAPPNVPTGEERPRRNYVNSNGTVDDETLYPYHTSLYPLLDAYDPLYIEPPNDEEWEITTEEILRRQPIANPERAVPPSHLAPSQRHYRNFYRNVPGDDEDFDDAEDDVGNVEGYSPASAEATMLTLLGGFQSFNHQPAVEQIRMQDFFAILDDVTLALAHKFLSPSFLVEKEVRKRANDEHDRHQYLHRMGLEPVNLSTSTSLVGINIERGEVEEIFWWRGRSVRSVEGPRDEDLSNSENQVLCHGIDHMSSDPRVRTTALLRLLRHSLSELQRDHRLAAAVSFNLMTFRDFDDVSVLSKFLAICDLEYGARLDLVSDAREEDEDGTFLPPINPIRYEIYMFGRDISKFLAVGMVSVTRPHAVALSGFCRHVFEREVGHLHTERHLHHKPRKGSGGTDEHATPTSFEERQRWSAKRYAFLRYAEEDRDAAFTSSKKVPLCLVQEVIRGLSLRAMIEKHRLLKYFGKDPKYPASGEDDAVDEEVLVQSLEAFHNCLFALVDIGEAAIKYLPTSERFYSLASELVRAFVYVLADISCWEFIQTSLKNVPVNQIPDYLGQTDPNLKRARVASSHRFADCIARASEREAALRDPRIVQGLKDSTKQTKHATNLVAKIDVAFYGKPPLCVQEVVRGLFVRDLVDVLWAGCGYNDFCLWCRFDVTPLDSAMYWHDTSYPGENYRAAEDDEDEDEEHERNDDEILINWDFDEEENEMNLGCVGASLDYSLMLLLREWYRPWSPESHASFSPEFRSAMKTVLLASHRVHLPSEVTHRVLEFLPRDWWPDARRHCWNFDCQVDSTQNFFNADRDVRPAIPERFITSNEYVRCPHCRIATYCSETCRTSDWKNFHKSYCNRPPCRIPGPDEEALIVSVEGPDGSMDDVQAITSLEAPAQQAPRDDASAEVVEDDGDEDWEDEESDNDEWEDVESDNEGGNNGGEANRTQRIYRYFRDRAYRLQE